MPGKTPAALVAFLSLAWLIAAMIDSKRNADSSPKTFVIEPAKITAHHSGGETEHYYSLTHLKREDVAAAFAKEGFDAEEDPYGLRLTQELFKQMKIHPDGRVEIQWHEYMDEEFKKDTLINLRRVANHLRYE